MDSATVLYFAQIADTLRIFSGVALGFSSIACVISVMIYLCENDKETVALAFYWAARLLCFIIFFVALLVFIPQGDIVLQGLGYYKK